MFVKLFLFLIVAFASVGSSIGQENHGGGNGCRFDNGDNSYTGAFDRLSVIGLTDDQRLVCFKASRPSKPRNIGTVTGLGGTDTALVGIDFRVQDGKLYGVGNGGGVYTIETDTAVATLADTLDIALIGTSFGVDFNPAANALRIVSNTGQNLRHSFVSGTTTNDAALGYPAPGTTPALGITGAAYTNNDLDANTATTLFDIDSNLDQIAIQAPANSGQLSPTGKLTFDTGAAVGFDIYSKLRDGVTISNTGYAVLTVSDESKFYRVNLLTGKASLRGAFRGENQVVDIAIPLDN